MLHLSFASFAVRAAAPLLLEPFPSSCFRFFQVPREPPFVSRSCSLKYLCFSFLSFKVTTLRKSDPTRPETQITYPRDGRQSLAPVDINTRERKQRGRETPSVSNLSLRPCRYLFNGNTEFKPTIGDKIVETLYINRATSENKRIRTPPLSPPFKVGVFVVCYR